MIASVGLGTALATVEVAIAVSVRLVKDIVVRAVSNCLATLIDGKGMNSLFKKGILVVLRQASPHQVVRSPLA